jgi:hypothetical protein
LDAGIAGFRSHLRELGMVGKAGEAWRETGSTADK